MFMAILFSGVGERVNRRERGPPFSWSLPKWWAAAAIEIANSLPSSARFQRLRAGMDLANSSARRGPSVTGKKGDK
jgi:hypothetical protein